jgi:hypothetical protein
MIKVTVEILPGGFTGNRRTLGLMHVANISDLADRSDYEARIAESANPLTGTAPRTCHVFVRDHDRRQSVWILIGAAIQAMEGAEFDDI